MHMGIWLGLGLLFYIFFVRQESPPPELISDANGVNGIELKRSQDGHFYIDGMIQGKRVRFLIDTGASIVSIQQSLALHMGLNCDRISTFSTANGQVKGCTTRVATLSFGPFQIENANVVILPNLGGKALLGMNALQRVHIEQKGDRLRLFNP